MRLTSSKTDARSAAKDAAAAAAQTSGANLVKIWAEGLHGGVGGCIASHAAGVPGLNAGVNGVWGIG